MNVELPPVPLQKPSPGQVPPEGWVELASSFCAEDSMAGKAAGVSSDGEVWVMCQLGSCSAGGCGMGGGLRRSAS